ncbi:hypothetical protein [uncultured Porphyromonas sp.]|uniref:hypothetical protein n=1 Tax=uncultured Porphyromonas sp. TaxID=159274 RepID=UPI002612E3C6|nr:hypothetical protein [uncultured Porphyromonas sp.]
MEQTDPKKLSNRYCPEGMSVEAWQIALRKQFAEQNDFTVSHLDKNRIWGDYMVQSGSNHYRVAFRGVRSDRNYCACLDFRTSGLGTCKHIEAVINYLSEEVPGYPWGTTPFQPDRTSIFISYKGGRTIECNIGKGKEELYADWQARYFEGTRLPPKHYHLIDQITREAKELSSTFQCYDDVYEMIRGYLRLNNWRELVTKKLPTGELPQPYVQAESSLEMRQTLYQLLQQSYGIIPAPHSETIIEPMIAMMRFVSVHDPGRMLIIVHNEEEQSLWYEILEVRGVTEGVTVALSSEVTRQNASISGAYSFVYVACGEKLSKWTDPVSIAIKRLVISHLYISVPHLSLFTPLQFSSITQHIDPYLLGPTYLFIEDAKQFFPMTDLPERLPQRLEGLITFLPDDPTIRTYEPQQPTTPSEEPVYDDEALPHQLLQALRDAIADPKRRIRLLETLDAILQAEQE